MGYLDKTLDVVACVAGVFCGDHTVPHNLGGGEVGRARGEFDRMIDVVTPTGDAYAIWINLFVHGSLRLSWSSNSAVNRDVDKLL